MPSEDFLPNWLTYELGTLFTFGIVTFLPIAAEMAANNGTNSSSLFTPTLLNTKQWVDTAVTVQSKYVYVTALWYGGFKLYPSQYAYGIAETAWYAANKIDPVGSVLSDAKARGLKTGIYFHVRDPYWEEHNIGWTYPQNQARVISYLTELAGLYPYIDFIWTDGWAYEIGYVLLDYATIIATIESLWPGITHVDNNHFQNTTHGAWAPYEASVPSANNAFPAESIIPVYGTSSWAWHNDSTPFVPATMAATLNVDFQLTAPYRANQSINFSPDSTGLIPSDQLTLASLLYIGRAAPPTTTAYPAAVISAMPLFYAPCNDIPDGKIVDIITGTNGGWLFGNHTIGTPGPIVSQQVNRYLGFDGSTVAAFADLNNVDITGTMSMSCCIKMITNPTSGNLAKVISKEPSGYYLRIYNNPGNTVELQAGSYDGSDHNTIWTGFGAATAGGGWHSILAGYTGTAWQIYFDGALVSTDNNATGAVAATGSLNIGTFLIADVSQIALFNTAPTLALASGLAAAAIFPLTVPAPTGFGSEDSQTASFFWDDMGADFYTLYRSMDGASFSILQSGITALHATDGTAANSLYAYKLTQTQNTTASGFSDTVTINLSGSSTSNGTGYVRTVQGQIVPNVGVEYWMETAPNGNGNIFTSDKVLTFSDTTGKFTLTGVVGSVLSNGLQGGSYSQVTVPEGDFQVPNLISGGNLGS